MKILNIKTYIELTKPRIVTLVLVTTIFGYVLGIKGTNSHFSIYAVLFLSIGTMLTAGGSAVLNNFLERDTDAKMERTRKRALATKAIAAHNALAFGIILVLVGTAVLVNYINLLTGFLSLLTAFLYVVVYTPLKKITWLNTAIGAIPGAIPPLGGWAAATGSLSPNAWIIFLILFIWQHPHFFAIAWMYKEDYKRGGFKMLPVVAPDGTSTFWHMVVYALLLIPVSLLPTFTGMAGKFYLLTVLVAGVLMLKVCVEAQKSKTLIDARRVLKATVFYLPVLLAAILIDINLPISFQNAYADIKTLPLYSKANNFTLTDQDSKSFTLSSIENKNILINFFFTSCPAICPKTLGHMQEIQKKHPELELISVTVDPEVDTPERLKEYTNQKGYNWHFLTGDLDKIKEIAGKNLKLGLNEDLSDHTTRLVLVDKEGNIRKYYDGLNNDVVKDVTRDLN